MIININRIELLSLARQTAKAVPNTETVPALRGIHLFADERSGKVVMTATNFEIAIQTSLGATVEEGGTAAIHAPLLVGMLSKLSGDTVRFESVGDTDTQLRVSSEQAHYDIGVLPGKQFPMPELTLPAERISVKGIPALARNTIFAASTGNESRASLKCVYLLFGENGLTATTCNGLQIMQTNGDTEAVGDTSILVPAMSMRTLLSITPNDAVFEVGVTDKTVVFWDGALFFSARTIHEAYLDTASIFDRVQTAYTVAVDAEQLRVGLSAQPRWHRQATNWRSCCTVRGCLYLVCRRLCYKLPRRKTTSRSRRKELGSSSVHPKWRARSPLCPKSRSITILHT